MKFIEIGNLRGVFSPSNNTKSKTIVVCIPGFEGVGTTAPKFIQITNELLSLPSTPIAGVVRYDPTGLGLSDGDFHRTTLDTLVNDLTQIMNHFLIDYEKFIFIAHSLGSCILIDYLKMNNEKIRIEKIVLLAPALNQFELHRYWSMLNIDKKLTWQKFQEIFREKDFENFLNSKSSDDLIPMRAHHIRHEFIRLCSAKDYSFQLENYQSQILHIHGTDDRIVPIESIKDRFIHVRLFQTTDHDLEEPTILSQWTKETVEFLSELS